MRSTLSALASVVMGATIVAGWLFLLEHYTVPQPWYGMILVVIVIVTTILAWQLMTLWGKAK